MKIEETVVFFSKVMYAVLELIEESINNINFNKYSK